MPAFLARKVQFWMVVDQSPIGVKGPNVLRISTTLQKLLILGAIGITLITGIYALLSDHTRLKVLNAHRTLLNLKLKDELDEVSNKYLEATLREEKLIKRITELTGDLSQAKQQTNQSRREDLGVEGELARLNALVKEVERLNPVTPAASEGGLLRKRATSVRVNEENLGGKEIDCSTSEGRCSMFNSSPTKQAEHSYDSVNLKSVLQSIEKLPLGAPTEGELSSGYGFRLSPFGDGLRLHEGIDLSAPFGAAVRSTGAGKVLTVRVDGTYGLMVDVKHTTSIVTRYAHLSRAFVNVGQSVKRGQLLAQVGSSGRSTGPHLHYEVMVNNRAIDPMRMYELVTRHLKTSR
jgi:murein DD-endopeptidase MepM/ murein hydrolase activator NlpD